MVMCVGLCSISETVKLYENTVVILPKTARKLIRLELLGSYKTPARPCTGNKSVFLVNYTFSVLMTDDLTWTKKHDYKLTSTCQKKVRM